MRYATLMTTSGIGLHGGGTASTFELSQAAYVHLEDPTISKGLKNCGGFVLGIWAKSCA
jgi:hypothetical protein